MQNKQGIKWGILLLWAILIGAIVVAVCYFLQINPVYDSTIALVKALKLDGGLTSLFTLAKNNWTSILGIGGSIAVPSVLSILTDSVFLHLNIVVIILTDGLMERWFGLDVGNSKLF